MSASTNKTNEEWADLCASQERTIKKLSQEKSERGNNVNKMKKIAAGIGDLMDQQTQDFGEQMMAARAVIASLKVFKAQYEADGVKMSDAVAFADDQEKRFETLEAAAKVKGPY